MIGRKRSRNDVNESYALYNNLVDIDLPQYSHDGNNNSYPSFSHKRQKVNEDQPIK